MPMAFNLLVDDKPKYDLLAVEEKKPGHHNYQTVPDKNKIEIELKQMTNVLVGDDIPAAKAAGIVIDGMKTRNAELVIIIAFTDRRLNIIIIPNLLGYDVTTAFGELNYEIMYWYNKTGQCKILKNKFHIETVISTYEHFKQMKVTIKKTS